MATQLLTPALNVFEHMALDEVIAHQNSSEPVLRFYHWAAGAAVTFGCSQFYTSVRGQVGSKNGPLCRRPTGGGMVFHKDDLTFSLVFTSSLRPAEIYARLHGAVEQALWQAELAKSVRQAAVPAAAYTPAEQGIARGCFASPVQDDLLVDGQKILGGAIRRFDKTVLYQGSLQCAGARTNPLFRRAIGQAAGKMLSVSFQTAPVTAPVLQQAKQQAVCQYQTRQWTEKFL